MALSADRSRNAVGTAQGEPLSIKVGSLAPSLVANLFNPDGTPFSITGTVTFRMREFFSRVEKIAAGVVQVEDPGEARVRYDWQTGDTDTGAEYEAWFDHTDGAGRAQSFPNQGAFTVRVEP